MTPFNSTHNLDFLVAPWKPMLSVEELAKVVGPVIDDDPWPSIPWKLFKVGTCEGQWRATPVAYEILSIVNTEKGNGHLTDVLEWFEYSCRRDGLKLRILSFENQRFKRHLIHKRGFIEEGDNVEKSFLET